MNKFMVGIFVFCSLIPISSFASSWAKAYGGTDEDFGSCIQQTAEGGYAIASFTETFGDGQEDFLLIKLDSAGVISWSKTFGDGFSDIATTVKQTSDNGYIMVGGTRCYGAGQYDLFVVKTDALGNLSWAKAIGGSSIDAANSVQQTSDGGYIVAGFSYSYSGDSSDIFVIKLTSTGTTSWATSIGGTGEDVVTNCIQQTTDGGYIVAGWTTSFGAGGSDFFIIKLASGGNVSWARVIGGSSDDAANAIQQTSDGGYLVVGNTTSYGAGGQDVLVIKLTSTGTVSWATTYGGSSLDNPWSTYQATDGDYMVVGETQSFGMGGQDFLVMKLGSTGNITWAKTFGGAGDECANWVIQTSSGEFMVAGDAQSFGPGGYDVLVIKINQDGTMAPTCPWYPAAVNTSNPTPSSSSPTVGANELPSNVSVFPTVTSPSVQAVDICADAAVEENKNYIKGNLSCIANPVSRSAVINYQIPVTSKVSLKVYDISGICVKNILNEEKQAGNYSININTKNLNAGVYLVSLNAGNLRETKKLILVK